MEPAQSCNGHHRAKVSLDPGVELLRACTSVATPWYAKVVPLPSQPPSVGRDVNMAPAQKYRFPAPTPTLHQSPRTLD